MSRSARVWLAIGLTALAGVVLVIPLALAAITFLRDRMHLYCSFLHMGSDMPGEYYCADGIGYILPGLLLGFWVGLMLLATGLVVALLLERRLRAAQMLSAIASAGCLFVITASLIAATPRAGSGDFPENAWADVMAVPCVLLGGASLLLVVSIFVTGRFAAVTRFAALGLASVGTVVEPSIVFGTIPAVLALLLAIMFARDKPPAGHVLDAHSRSSIA